MRKNRSLVTSEGIIGSGDLDCLRGREEWCGLRAPSLVQTEDPVSVRIPVRSNYLGNQINKSLKGVGIIQKNNE
jgi:hypothetical protein